MENKSLLFGIGGFILGGLVVSVAATTFDNADTAKNNETTMSQMTAELTEKSGEDYDKAFIHHMIDHHKAAVDMAKLSAGRAKHDEIKNLSKDIINAQEKEISQMQKWLVDWGYGSAH